MESEQYARETSLAYGASAGVGLTYLLSLPPHYAVMAFTMLGLFFEYLSGRKQNYES